MPRGLPRLRKAMREQKERFWFQPLGGTARCGEILAVAHSEQLLISHPFTQPGGKEKRPQRLSARLGPSLCIYSSARSISLLTAGNPDFVSSACSVSANRNYRRNGRLVSTHPDPSQRSHELPLSFPLPPHRLQVAQSPSLSLLPYTPGQYLPSALLRPHSPLITIVL